MKIFLVFSAIFYCLTASILESDVPFNESQEGLPFKTGARIHNGYPATKNQFPYTVAIRLPNTDRPTFSTCGGSLLTSTWVLTAAHCTTGRIQYNLRFGSLHRREGGVSVTSFLAINHPNYNRTHSLNFDLSLIHIPKPVKFSEAIQPIRLPRLSQAADTFVGRRAVLSGWGAMNPETGVVNLLRYVFTRIISNEACRNNFRSRAVVDHVVCTLGYAMPNQGSCSGDSGGPLVLVGSNNVNVQVGIVSFGASPSVGGCAAGFGTGYTRTASFLPWISRHTGIVLKH